jgi:hypothetical protein
MRVCQLHFCQATTLLHGFIQISQVRIKSDHSFYLNQFSKVSPEMSASWHDLSADTYLFHTNKGDLRASHLVTILYRTANTDIWSVIPAFSDNSALIPRARPPQTPKMEQIEEAVAPGKKGKAQKPPKPKPFPSLVLKPTPMQRYNPSAGDRTLLTYIINSTPNFTLHPLGYCGIAHCIKGRGDDV